MKLKKQTSKTFNNKESNLTTNQSSPDSNSNGNTLSKQTSTHSLSPSNITGIAISKDKSPVNSRQAARDSHEKLSERSSTELINKSSFNNSKQLLASNSNQRRSALSTLLLTPINSPQIDPSSLKTNKKVGAYVPPHRLNHGTPSSLSPFSPFYDYHGEDENSFYSNISSDAAQSPSTIESPSSSFSDQRKRKSLSSTNYRAPPQLKRIVPRASSSSNNFLQPKTLVDPARSGNTKYPITIMDDRSRSIIEQEHTDQEHEEDNDSIYSDCPPPSIVDVDVDGEELDHCQSGSVLMSKKQRSLLDALDLPSPVWEVDENQEYQEGILNEGEEDIDVCTGCGTLPVASFVALIPCDHLVCHTCLNALINAAAHTPPRPMVCFACGILLDSFGPAFEEEQGQGAGLGMVNNLLASLKNRDSVRVEEKVNTADTMRRGGKIDIGEMKERRKSGNSSSSNTGGWRENFGRQDYSNTVQQDYKFGSGFNSNSCSRRASNYSSETNNPFPTSTAYETRHSSLSSGGISTPHMVSPLSLRYSSSNSTGKTKVKTLGGSMGIGGGGQEFNLSPFRNLDWSVETENSPRIKDWKTTSPTAYKTVPPVVTSTKISSPIEWTVVRIDNIPWDITVPELEDWLPKDSLAPADDCVLSVHILCNRADGRTLNQCYVETASLTSARNIVRTRDGKKLRGRPVHVTLSNQSQLMSEIFPGWTSGFNGLRANAGKTSGPLLVQTELTGLLALCKLQTNHAYKVKERPYYNIVTILEKFPWHQVEAYNDKQIVRLFNTSCAAVEILSTVRNEVPEWVEILTTMVAAVTACPVFRLSQKTKFVQLTGLSHSKYAVNNGLQSKYNLPQGQAMFDSTNVFSFSPPSLKEAYVTVENSAAKVFYESENESPSKIFNVLPPGHRRKISSFSSTENSPVRLSKSISSPNLFSGHKSKTTSTPSPVKRRPRRVSSISRQFGMEIEMVKAVALELGITVVS